MEPCAMCAGTMLHARLARVVYGARDPKTGAAGSVVDLFSLQQLNHQTRVKGDVLFDVCARVIRAFFHQRRQQGKVASRPLRDNALRTPEERFSHLPHRGLQSAWSMSAPIQQGWQMHWIDTSANGSEVPVLCLHGPGQWGYFFRHVTDIKKVRWIIPDLIGFGRSDKPKRESVHNWEWHNDVLLQWLTSLQTGPVWLAYAESAAPLVDLLRMKSLGLIGQRVFPMPDEHTGHASEAWQAPFPDRGHEAALRALGRAEVTSSGPSHAQALQIAGAIVSHAVDTMGYCRP
ncbi:MAG: tRNA adenosine(34) deaminase TadA [Cytophagaceae bacterium]|nr:MAG: tRNA adenosine(34) deaminase TadA [Cytophagaceae bacterium]